MDYSATTSPNLPPPPVHGVPPWPAPAQADAISVTAQAQRWPGITPTLLHPAPVRQTRASGAFWLIIAASGIAAVIVIATAVFAG